MLTLYICLGYLVAPVAFAVSLWRGLADRSYWRALPERFGFGAPTAPGGLWVHAVSVGEVQAAAVLVRRLRERYPGLPLVISCGTPTGRSRAEALFGSEVSVRYLPYDLPDAVARFLDRVRPQLGVIVETELWPSLYGAARRRGIPLVLASARLSARSVRRYRWLTRLTRPMLCNGVAIAAQTAADALRFRDLGAPAAHTHVTGNLKFDVAVAAQAAAAGLALRAVLGAARPVWVAGSTHQGEEEILLAAQALVAARRTDALLVLAPRHPPRFAVVAALLERQGVRFVRRTSGAPVAADTQVLLLDTLGELVAFYAAGDVAFVGGSLVPVGGHNLLEPAALGRPVLCGPHTANSGGVAALLAAAGALEVVGDARVLAARVGALLDDPAARARAGERGREVIEANRGAVERVLALIAPGVRAPPG